MGRMIEKFNDHGLFIKMFLVMVVSIIAVSVTITYSTIRMSERLFMDTFSITNTKVIHQVKSNFETFSNSVATAANEVQQSGTIKNYLSQGDTTSLEMAKLYYNTHVQMDRAHLNVDDYELSMMVTGVNGRSFSTDRANWVADEEQIAALDLTKNTLEEPRKLLYQLDTENGAPMIVVTKALIERTTDSIYGAFYLSIRESEFKRFYSSFTSEGNDLLIMKADGSVLSSNRADMIGDAAPELLNEAAEIEEEGIDFREIEWQDTRQIMLAEHLPALDMYVVNLIDQEVVMDNLINTKTVVASSFLIVLAAVSIVFLISRRMTKSLSQLVREISALSKNNFDQYVTATGSFETKQLAYAFNDMLDELHNYVEELIQTQKKQRNAELAALQRQINPHFLYNTLTSVKIMVQQGNKEKAADTVNALISLLQNAVGNVHETMTVQAEIDNLKSYVFINQVRYGERIQVSYFIAPDCEELHVPKLIIQPFIENAFFHAFNQKTDGFIHIIIFKEENTLVCEIIDNGDGMQIDSRHALPDSRRNRQLFSGIGVRNVHERIKLLYGSEFGVHISSNPGEGTHIRITLPIISSNNNPKI
ncbi:sensor histidine kinase [Domibacillus enclensis]|uniref:Two-component sensor histidine kinase n=1 Tax=Domibacillus enclensis TaxID=1017273 RepID=A0A1N6WS16_9BACI|nr:sensor histidine kinase [Domibacillus enclensis]OXS78016.1 two-component sensor histidine kinase [Domibacillus enclensis]SIQ92812.1 two-component system, sensor histidine kinase YesM [Domibacillus enclensis]